MKDLRKRASTRSILVSRLRKSATDRESYVGAKLSVLIASQIRALRADMTQKELASLLGMKQSRVSAMENPGAVSFSLATLIRVAAALKVALKVEFTSFSELTRWEESYRPQVTPLPLERDVEFISGALTQFITVHSIVTPPVQVMSPPVRGDFPLIDAKVSEPAEKVYTITPLASSVIPDNRKESAV